MALKNMLSIETTTGYKNIEIHHGDLSAMEFSVDILVISAFRHGYNPTPGTLIEALEKNCQLKVLELFQSKQLDFRETLNSWVSADLPSGKFKNIVCLEGMFESLNDPDRIEHYLSDLLAVLSVLQHKGFAIKTVAMPLLGTGQQGIAVELLIPVLMTKAKEMLQTIHEVQTIYFVHPRMEIVEQIDKGINQFLSRSSDLLELIRDDREIAEGLDRISTKLIGLKHSFGWSDMKSLDELSYRIIQQDIRFYELGILSRRAMESILKSLIRSEGFMTLSEMVFELRRFNLSPWMLSYMHTLRSFGNFLAHDVETHTSAQQMTKDDVLFFVKALDRFVDIVSNNCRNI